MSADNQVTDPLLADGVAHIENSTSPTDPDTKNKYYTLPSLRYTSVVRTIIFIDVVFSLALWISGNDHVVHVIMDVSWTCHCGCLVVHVIINIRLYMSLWMSGCTYHCGC